MTLADLLKKARADKCFSLQEAADMLGISKAHLHEMEQGKTTNPTLRVIAALVIIYGLRPEAIIATATITDVLSSV
jgi:transcriptional regulator with XRE-family HTH domain